MSQRPIRLSIDQQSFDDFLDLTPDTAHVLYLMVHSKLLERFGKEYESFPRAEDMLSLDKELVKLEAMLLMSLVRRGYRYDAIVQDKSL